jgi:hypothetical protein
MNHKKKMIQEIKSIKKEELFKPPIKKNNNLLNKILKIFGYGKKG